MRMMRLSRFASVLALCVLANMWVLGSCSMCLMWWISSPAHGQPADKSQLRAKIKSAAEKLNRERCPRHGTINVRREHLLRQFARARPKIGGRRLKAPCSLHRRAGL